MSLILEALKKLEREKRSSEPGFLVLGATAWPGVASGRRRAALALGGVAVLGAAALIWAGREAAKPAPSARQASQAPPAPPAPGAAGREPAANTRADVPIVPRLDEPKPRVPDAPPASEPSRPVLPEDGTPAGPPPAVVAPASAASPGPSLEVGRRFRLQAISRRDGRPVAVLNERLVYEGESFDGVTLVRIGEAEVELEVDGRRVVVGF